MEGRQRTDNEQAMLWNGPAGRGWVEAQEVLDQMLHPFEALLVAPGTTEASQVLDVGCGTGSTTLALARGGSGKGRRCLGIDLSEPMLAAARARAEQEGVPVRFVCADAQDHPFETASFDLIVSRFGVMFFNDPIQAFANLRRAARDGAALRFVAWRSASENPFMTAAERAAGALLPPFPARLPEAPGPFAFADPHRIRHILEESGWAELDLQPIDVACAFPEQALLRYLTWVGPVGRVLQDADDQTRERVLAKIRPAFVPYVSRGQVSFLGACWMVRARAAS